MVRQAKGPLPWGRATQSTSFELPPLLRSRKVQAVLVLLLALWAHKQWRFSRFNRGPFPDSWQRPADQHRGYIKGLVDFVDLYSQGSKEEAGDQLLDYIGVHTRCYTSQLALTAYYCGKEMAGSGGQYDRSPTSALRSLLTALHDGRAGDRARALRWTVAHQAVLAGFTIQGTEASPDADGPQKADGGGSDGEGEEDDEEEDWEEEDDEEEGYGERGGGADPPSLLTKARQAVQAMERRQRGTSLGAWDGEQLPQLVVRAHIRGDDIAGHTFVIAMRPDLTFDVYQSFIGQYTLHDYLNWEPRALSYDQMMQFLADMERIEAATVWTREIDKLYQRLFKVSLSRTRGYRGVKLGGGGGAASGSASAKEAARSAGLSAWAMGEGKAVRMVWRLVCTVPSNATERAQEPGVAFQPFSF